MEFQGSSPSPNSIFKRAGRLEICVIYIQIYVSIILYKYILGTIPQKKHSFFQEVCPLSPPQSKNAALLAFGLTLHFQSSRSIISGLNVCSLGMLLYIEEFPTTTKKTRPKLPIHGGGRIDVFLVCCFVLFVWAKLGTVAQKVGQHLAANQSKKRPSHGGGRNVCWFCCFWSSRSVERLGNFKTCCATLRAKLRASEKFAAFSKHFLFFCWGGSGLNSRLPRNVSVHSWILGSAQKRHTFSRHLFFSQALLVSSRMCAA